MITYASGPGLDSIMMAYNPITVQATDSITPPVVFCDVYIMDEYYKTISSTSPVYVFPGGSSVWEFDISGVMQEWLKSAIPDITVPSAPTDPALYDMYLGPGAYNPDKHGGAATVYCKIRSSTADSYGVVTPEGPEPVQATVDTAAVAGVGYMIDRFLVINGAMQYSSNEILSSAAVSLRMWKRFGVFSTVGYYVVPESKIYPLSKIPNGKVYAKEYGQFPIVTAKWGIFTPLTPGPTYMNAAWMTMAVECYDSNGVRLFAAPAGPYWFVGESIYNIPVGLANLTVIFPGMLAVLPNTEYYHVFLWDEYYGSIPGNLRMQFVTPKYYVQQGANEFVAKHVRLWFRNFYGHLDQLNFRERNDKVEVKSTGTERKRNRVSRVYHSGGRNNVRANTEMEVTEVFEEGDMRLIEELMASSQVYMDTSTDVELLANGQGYLLPVVVEDVDFVRRKWENRYQYDVTVKYKMSHEATVVRG